MDALPFLQVKLIQSVPGDLRFDRALAVVRKELDPHDVSHAMYSAYPGGDRRAAGGRPPDVDVMGADIAHHHRVRDIDMLPGINFQGADVCAPVVHSAMKYIHRPEEIEYEGAGGVVVDLFRPARLLYPPRVYHDHLVGNLKRPRLVLRDE